MGFGVGRKGPESIAPLREDQEPQGKGCLSAVRSGKALLAPTSTQPASYFGQTSWVIEGFPPSKCNRGTGTG